ncbi:RNA polymerase sigma factor [Bradyrhizobium sp. U87765 SZCCT0131]|uniref:RNA polymerase sigma factor n=1 Tax=unclassified Bradyrhizobium TaxID=2631580 RepID=UPI001BA9E0F6|nr:MULTISPECIES: RNA polymerase sigma factor [unclassified Bradyrhizobium]MBR1220958.1 RNA polymerase sigma factor [Bradyrhizobium sp. U87765 SZCCT0131]MBR1260222.1 RNA polymerase sigma factor [Bradyrhizobium sp. U87765 SZCCT0134]MBR1307529.1 RNA polymerase sigma factor [Bradyrhizobium sp. U87765 SZCCT0110]MBR1321483.1 RNA polymerase sigma factor [Bradyrhizobium sp. U87765 SZCCT0109]MBR1349796.1 RNA polymerase sigma factor [Bradyrhizobium sp. U87765 SZCCT0048]
MAVALDIWSAIEVDTVPAMETRVREAANVPSIASAAPQVRDEDEELLDRLAANDETAFRMLVERHIDRAFSIALRIVGSRADAEDVVQDTMLKVWTHRGRWLQGRAKFSTWLYRVITNRCIDLRRQPRTDDVDAVPEPADTRPDAASTMQREEVTDLLEQAMQQLPEHQRIAVIFSYHEDMSNGEIAEVMQTTVAAVESLLKRGRQQLKAILRRHERDIRHVFTES